MQLNRYKTQSCFPHKLCYKDDVSTLLIFEIRCKEQIFTASTNASLGIDTQISVIFTNIYENKFRRLEHTCFKS